MESWISASPSSGNGDGSFSVQVGNNDSAPNATLTPRTGTVTVSSGGTSKQVSVSQKPVGYICLRRDVTESLGPLGNGTPVYVCSRGTYGQITTSKKVGEISDFTFSGTKEGCIVLTPSDVLAGTAPSGDSIKLSSPSSGADYPDYVIDWSESQTVQQSLYVSSASSWGAMVGALSESKLSALSVSNAAKPSLSLPITTYNLGGASGDYATMNVFRSDGGVFASADDVVLTIPSNTFFRVSKVLANEGKAVRVTLTTLSNNTSGSVKTASCQAVLSVSGTTISSVNFTVQQEIGQVPYRFGDAPSINLTYDGSDALDFTFRLKLAIDYYTSSGDSSPISQDYITLDWRFNDPGEVYATQSGNYDARWNYAVIKGVYMSVEDLYVSDKTKLRVNSGSISLYSVSDGVGAMTITGGDFNLDQSSGTVAEAKIDNGRTSMWHPLSGVTISISGVDISLI